MRGPGSPLGGPHRLHRQRSRSDPTRAGRKKPRPVSLRCAALAKNAPRMATPTLVLTSSISCTISTPPATSPRNRSSLTSPIDHQHEVVDYLLEELRKAGEDQLAEELAPRAAAHRSSELDALAAKLTAIVKSSARLPPHHHDDAWPAPGRGRGWPGRRPRPPRQPRLRGPPAEGSARGRQAPPCCLIQQRSSRRRGHEAEGAGASGQGQGGRGAGRPRRPRTPSIVQPPWPSC